MLNFRDNLIEFLVLHLDKTYFAYLNNSDLIILHINLHIKSIIPENIFKLPLDINKLEKYIYDEIYIYLINKILSFNNRLDDYSNFMSIENNFNEYENQTVYDKYYIYYYDSFHRYDYHKYYYENYTIQQSLTILHAFTLAENEEYMNITKKLIKYIIYHKKKDTFINNCILCDSESKNLQFINDEIIDYNSEKKIIIKYKICNYCNKILNN